jgi:lipopolysaccharide export LptBFGC system permease protein LptF
MSAIRQGVFNVVGDSVVYIGRKSKNAIEDIFISYVPNGGKRNTNIIAAKSGDYILKDNKLFIRLKKGYRQELDKNNSIISMLSFNNFSYNVSQFVRQYSARVNKVYENTQDELLTMASKTNNPRLKNKYLAEFHGRIIMSFTPLINSLIVSIFMLAAWVYRKRSLLAFQAFLCSVIFQIMIMTLVNTSSKHESLIIINYIIILLMILGLFIILFRKKVS